MNTEMGASILVVDDTSENLRLLSQILRRNGLVPRPATSGAMAIKAAIADIPDLILLDLLMPEMSGLDVCRWFKQDERLRNIPIIFISGNHENDSILEAFRVGCADYITKPFQDEEVLARIKLHLGLRQLNVNLESKNLLLENIVKMQVKAATESQLATIFALAKIAESRDSDTGHHIERVQTFTRILAEQMREMRLYPLQLTKDFIETLYETSSLHDIGKVGIPDAVLLKPGKLTDEEFTIMKEHCALGADTLASVMKRYPDNQFLQMGVDVARSHQEKWDGNGYPDGLKGQESPLAARIVSVADFYDALTSKRCYHQAFPHEEAVRMIVESSGTHFDPDVVEAFKCIEKKFKLFRMEMGD